MTQGNYVITSQPPIIVSSLGAIPKTDSKVRLIHDCSRPAGQAVNDFATLSDKQSFQTIDDAVKAPFAELLYGES